VIGRRRLLGLATLAAAAPACHAVAIEPYAAPSIVEHRLAWPGPKLRIAVLADLHAGGPTMQESRIAGIVETTNALRPDLVALLGDYGLALSVEGRAVPQALVARLLSGLRAPLGVRAVLGNHDWWEDDAARHGRDPRATPLVARAFAQAGIPVLRNAAHRVGGVWIAGLDSQWAFGRDRGAHDVGAMLAAITDDAPVILLAHEPDIFAGLPGRIALTLSGHTHGGQVRVLGHSPMIPSRYGERYRHGLVTEEGRNLIVSAGLGTSFLPIRFGVPPEILLVTLGG
jgi:predicted MPP superfamily phosphohydrolase